MKLKNWMTLVYLVTVFTLFFIGLGDARGPLVISFLLAYLVFPLVQRMESKNIPRSMAVAGVFLVLSLLVAGVLVVVVPHIVREATDFSKELPSKVEKVVAMVQGFSEQQSLPIDISREKISLMVEEQAAGVSKSIVKSITRLFSGVLGLLNLFLIPLFFYYVVSDYEKIVKSVRKYLPDSILHQVDHIVGMSNTVLSGYVRGQLLVALCLAVLYSIGLSISGLKFGFLIGVLAGLVSIIPYAGFALGFATSIVVALADGASVMTFAGIIATFSIVQGLEGFIITPKLVGDKVGLSALSTMLALIIGGNLLGLPGMLLGIPIFAIIKNTFKELPPISS